MRPTRFCRPIFPAAVSAVAAWGLLLSGPGCVVHKDVQHFVVVDGEGNQNYYRVTVEGSSWGTEYQLRQGMFSVAAVDVLSGQTPKIAELDLPIEHERVLEESVSLYHQRLLTDGYARLGDIPPRARWLATANQIDILRARILTDDLVIKEADTRDQRIAELRDEIKQASDDPGADPQEIAALSVALDSLLAAQAGNAEAVEQARRRQPTDISIINQAYADLWHLTPDAGDLLLIKTAEDLKDPPQIANRPPPITTEERDLLDLLSSVPQSPNGLVMLARLAWYASLSTADIVSMGQNVTDDPYNFRKHVIYVTARNIDLQIIASEIDSVIGSVLTIAGAARQQAKQREAQRSAKRCALREFFEQKMPDAETLANLFVPEAEGSTDGFIHALRELHGLRAGLGERFERTGDQ